MEEQPSSIQEVQGEFPENITVYKAHDLGEVLVMIEGLSPSLLLTDADGVFNNDFVPLIYSTLMFFAKRLALFSDFAERHPEMGICVLTSRLFQFQWDRMFRYNCWPLNLAKALNREDPLSVDVFRLIDRLALTRISPALHRAIITDAGKRRRERITEYLFNVRRILIDRFIRHGQSLIISPKNFPNAVAQLVANLQRGQNVAIIDNDWVMKKVLIEVARNNPQLEFKYINIGPEPMRQRLVSLKNSLFTKLGKALDNIHLRPNLKI